MKTLLHRFDRKVTQKVQGWPAWLRRVMATASNIGHPYVTMTLGVILMALQINWSVTSAGILILLTILLSSLLKIILRRKRPLTYKTRSLIVTFSFPSGHTVGATVAYGVLAALAVSSGMTMVLVLSAAVMLIILVGLSRIYLGAHYPSDVVAGWLLGSACLAIILYAVQPAL